MKMALHQLYEIFGKEVTTKRKGHRANVDLFRMSMICQLVKQRSLSL